MGKLSRLAQWTLQVGLLEVVGSTASAISPARLGLMRNRRLKDLAGTARRCFVIGNGPSLKHVDLTRLSSELTIVANSFYKHPDATAMDPDFICVGDPRFFIDEERALSWHREIDARLPGAALLLNPDGQALIEKHRLYPGREVFFFDRGLPLHDPRFIHTDLTRPLNVGQTTGSLLMIPLAMYLGITEIYLLGFDCNWLDDPSTSYHFYDSQAHFPEFDSVAADDRGFTYETFARLIIREFECHRLLRSRAEQMGIRIRNASSAGRLDVYDRVDLDELLASPR